MQKRLVLALGAFMLLGLVFLTWTSVSQASVEAEFNTAVISLVDGSLVGSVDKCPPSGGCFETGDEVEFYVNDVYDSSTTMTCNDKCSYPISESLLQDPTVLEEIAEQQAQLLDLATPESLLASDHFSRKLEIVHASYDAFGANLLLDSSMQGSGFYILQGSTDYLSNRYHTECDDAFSLEVYPVRTTNFGTRAMGLHGNDIGWSVWNTTEDQDGNVEYFNTPLQEYLRTEWTAESGDYSVWAIYLEGWLPSGTVYRELIPGSIAANYGRKDGSWDGYNRAITCGNNNPGIIWKPFEVYLPFVTNGS